MDAIKNYVTLDYTYLIMSIKHKLIPDPNTFLYVIDVKTDSEGFKLNYIWIVYGYRCPRKLHFTLSVMLIVKVKSVLQGPSDKVPQTQSNSKVHYQHSHQQVYL